MIGSRLHGVGSRASVCCRRACRIGRSAPIKPQFTLLVALTSVVALAMLAGSASAYDPSYYDDPAYATALTSLAVASGSGYPGAALEAGMNPGGSYASASQAKKIRDTLLRARQAARTMPALRTLGTVGLAATAFDFGWTIGRTLDTKFLHFSDIAAGEIGFGDTYGLVRNINPWEWRWTAAAGEWRMRVYSEYGHPCGLLDTIPATFPGTLVDLYGTDRTTCKQFLLDAYVSLASVVGTVGATQSVSCPSSFFGSTYTGTPTACYRIVAPEAAMQSYWLSKLDQFTDWTGQSANHITSGYNPSYAAQGFASQDAQNAAFQSVLNAAADDSPGEYVDYALNPSGTVANPLIDFQMPSCWGLSVVDCENAISDAADAVGKTVSFNVTTAPYPNGDVARNLILSTFPAAGSMARPDEVALTENASTAPPRECTTPRTDNPHWSATSNSMLAKGYIRCNYTGTASFEMTLWHCTSSPQADLPQLLGGAYGCSVAAVTPESLAVVAAPPAPHEVYCPHVLPPGTASPVPWAAGYWIAATVLTNPSPIINGDPSLSQPGWQPPPP